MQSKVPAAGKVESCETNAAYGEEPTMKPKTKWCPMCELDLPANAFARLDKFAVCKNCQRETSSFTASETSLPGSGAFVYVRRKGLRTPGNHDRSKPQ